MYKPDMKSRFLKVQRQDGRDGSRRLGSWGLKIDSWNAIRADKIEWRVLRDEVLEVIGGYSVESLALVLYSIRGMLH